MPLGMMQSKAEMRSVATKSKRSPRSKISRTFPLLSFLNPGSSKSNKAPFDSVGMASICGAERNVQERKTALTQSALRRNLTYTFGGNRLHYASFRALPQRFAGDHVVIRAGQHGN